MNVTRYGAALKRVRMLQCVSQEGVSARRFSLRSLRRFENGQSSIKFTSLCSATEGLGVRLSELASLAEKDSEVDCPFSLAELEMSGWYFQSARIKIQDNVQQASDSLLQSVCGMMLIDDDELRWTEMFSIGLASLEELLRRSEVQYTRKVCQRLKVKVESATDCLSVYDLFEFRMLYSLTCNLDREKQVRLIQMANELGLSVVTEKLNQMVKDEGNRRMQHA